jgi:sugar O-acyltransferase (sialic acid O-acetyltransferase NeuD family)
MREILLVGGGGHCRSCIDVLEATGVFRIAGVVQPTNEPGETIFDYPVVGGDEDLPQLLQKTPRALVTVGQIRSAEARKRLFGLLKEQGADFPIVISPFARVSPRASLSPGTIVMHGAIVNAGAEFGSNGIVNSQALIEHGARMGDHCHVATGAIVNGDCVVEEECFIGSGAVLREGITIGAGSVIGAGCVVTKNLPAGSFMRASRRGEPDSDWRGGSDPQEGNAE